MREKKQKPPHPTQRKSVNGISCQKIAVRRNTAQSGAAGRSEFLRSRKFLKKRCYCRRVQKRQQIPLTKVAILCSRSAILSGRGVGFGHFAKKPVLAFCPCSDSQHCPSAIRIVFVGSKSVF